MNKTSRKYFWFGLVFVFLVGLVGGAFLVLRTTVTSGELVNSTPLSQGKSSDELLDELLKLNLAEKTEQSEYVPPEDKNLSDDFLSAMVSATGISESAVKKIGSSDFLVETVLPYFKSNEINLFPIIPTSIFKTTADSKINFKKYFTNTGKEVDLISKTIIKILEIDLENLADVKTQNNLTVYSESLGTSFEKLSEMEVPKKYVDVHKNIMVSAIAAKKMAETMLNEAADPLKTLIVLNQLDDAVLFWKESLTNYQNALLGKK
ncbi:MAG: hypothetical protein AAB928_02385 [Patescibacteria group bacterium]